MNRKQYLKNWRKENRKRLAGYKRNWHAKNKERVNKRRREVRNNIENKTYFTSRFQNTKKNAKNRNLIFNLTRKQSDEIYSRENCYFCGEKSLIRTIDRLDNTKGYILKNCVSACWKCNKLKGNITKEDKQRMQKILDML